MEWTFKNGVPIYAQIIDEMTMRIASGTYGPGDKLPSVRELALEAGVNPNTMQKAYAELERTGLVFSERTSGRFVTNDENVLKGLRQELALKYIDDLEEKLRKMGMTDKEIYTFIFNWLKDFNEIELSGEVQNKEVE